MNFIVTLPFNSNEICFKNISVIDLDRNKFV